MNTSSLVYDESLNRIEGLTWLPWVGRNHESRSPADKLLIVLETHYSNEEEEERLAAAREYLKQRQYTRDVVQECCVDQDWANPTLDNMHRLFGRGGHINRESFWSDMCFYNFVQRPMDYTRRERPLFSDFELGWKVFPEIAKVLRPAHCLFIGVEASNYFHYCMEQAHAKFEGAHRTEQVGRTWGRFATVDIEGTTVRLDFVQHSGSYFSYEKWHDYLKRNSIEFMRVIEDPKYYF
jgi:hypothetical protein